MYNQRREAGSGQLILSRAGGHDEGGGVPLVQLSRVTRLPQLGEGRGFASDRYIAIAVQTLGLQLDDEVIESGRRFHHAVDLLIALTQETPTSNKMDTRPSSGGIVTCDEIRVYPIEILLTTTLEDTEVFTRSCVYFSPVHPCTIAVFTWIISYTSPNTS